MYKTVKIKKSIDPKEARKVKEYKYMKRNMKEQREED